VTSSSRVLFAVPREQLPDFGELLDAWHERGFEVEIDCRDDSFKLPDPQVLLRQARASLDALLLAGPSCYAPATALPGPCLVDADRRRVAAAWLPLKSREHNRAFAAAAAQVQRRPAQQVSVALLAQWHPQYLRVADRIEALLASRLALLRWTGEVIGRDALLPALRTGLGLALYVGHGRPVGWVGYHGVRRHHFDEHERTARAPLGALLSLCCRTASRRHVGLSYAEALPLQGVAAASLGATSDTLHTDNTRWAVGLCDALLGGARRIGELVVRGAPASPIACAPYRLIGDPMAPLASERIAVARASAVPTWP